ncbi:MAG: type II secretion system F family protein [Gammaproteobacteria bacterium]
MSTYYFKAVGSNGDIVEEYREAESEQALVLSLQKEGLIPIRVTPEKGQGLFTFRRSPKAKFHISQKEVLLFSRELAALLEAGLPLDRALQVLIGIADEQSPLHALLNDILQRVKAGDNLSAALDAQGKIFSRFYINMIRAGEAGGNLEDILQRLVAYLESSLELRSSVITALIYPAILIIMSLASIFLLLTFVVPQFTEMFASAGKDLPVPTQIVVGAAEALQSYWWILLLLFLAGVYFFRYLQTNPTRKLSLDKRLLALPIGGDIVRNLETANLSRTLGTLLANGVSLLTALSIAKETVANSALREILAQGETHLKQGRGLSNTLIDSGQFPKMALQMIKMGEESGKLEEMLLKVADTYDKELKVTIQRMLALLEPILILGLGVAIAGIIISILMAILSINDLAF